MLGSARPPDGDHWPVQPGSAGTYVVCADPDALVARAVAACAVVVQAPANTDHGRECQLLDSEGNRWSFGTYPGAPHR